MKILEDMEHITNKQYAAKLLNSVLKKIKCVRDRIDIESEEEIMIAEIINCNTMLENVIEILEN